GRLRATAIKYVELDRHASSSGRRLARTIIGIAVLAAVVVAFLADVLPGIIAAAYFVFSVVSFLAYAQDKHAARRQAWRTPEKTLHLFDILGGWPGGLVAQERFHHKTA